MLARAWRGAEKSGTEKPSNELSAKKNTQGEKLKITEKIREEQLVDQNDRSHFEKEGIQ